METVSKAIMVAFVLVAVCLAIASGLRQDVLLAVWACFVVLLGRWLTDE